MLHECGGVISELPDCCKSPSITLCWKKLKTAASVHQELLLDQVYQACLVFSLNHRHDSHMMRYFFREYIPQRGCSSELSEQSRNPKSNGKREGIKRKLSPYLLSNFSAAAVF